MPLRDHALLCQPIIDCLRDGERPAWEIEEELATQFNVTRAERAQLHPNTGCPIWRNDVAFALKRLVEMGKIGASGKRRAPNGGMRGVYRLLRDEGLEVQKRIVLENKT